MRGDSEIIMVLLLWQTPVPYQCGCPFQLKRESLFCFVFDVEMAVCCCCFSTAFHIATATWLVLWSQNSLRGHIEPVTALSVLGFSDLRMPLSPGSLQNETLGVQEVCLQSGICSMFNRWGDAALGELGLCREHCLGPMHFCLQKIYKVSSVFKTCKCLLILSIARRGGYFKFLLYFFKLFFKNTGLIHLSELASMLNLLPF